MTKSLANKLRLKDHLYTLCMKPRTPVQDHLDEFYTILIDLENLDVDIDDEDKAVLVVISLPTSYKHFKEIMLYGNRDDDVKSALLSKQKYDDDVEPKIAEGLLKNKLEREGKGNNEMKPEKAAEVAIAKGDVPCAAVVSATSLLNFISAEKLTVELHSNGDKKFNLFGLLKLTVTDLKHRDFQIKIERRGSLDFKFKTNSSIDKGVFAQKSLLQWIVNCSTCVAGEQTKVTLDYDAFELIDLEDVHVIVPVMAEKVDFLNTIIGEGRYWYEPGKAKVHWLIRAINESNRIAAGGKITTV
ncbi:hypothetical protein Tco_0073885 [Tanacetum coccineum]